MHYLVIILFIIVAIVVIYLALYGISKLINLLNKSFNINRIQSNSNDINIDENQSTKEARSMNNILNTVTARFVIVGIIALLMLIPLSNVISLVDDRNRLYNDVLTDIANQWGKPQNIVGPMLVIPIIEKVVVEEKVKDNEGVEKTIVKDIFKNKNLVVLPKLLTKQVDLDEHYRSRSIYRSLVYDANLSIEGNFIIPEIIKLSDDLHKVRYEKAFVVMGLSDTKAINEISELEFGNKSIFFSPGVQKAIGGVATGFHAKVDLQPSTSHYPFAFNFNTKGSSNIRFSAFGETTKINLDSKWPHPSFQGAILPTSRNINADGFSAQWVIPSLARNFPQTWLEEDHQYNLNSLLTGVDLFEPIFLYSMIKRAVKYAILLVALTFLTFLIFELTSKSKLHYIQYGIVGLSLAMFYLVLLSLSEHILFLTAYLIASIITIIPISLYAWFNNHSYKHAIAIFCLLSAIYTIIYSLLQLEDYALLMGTGLLLAVMLTLMWITRNLHQTSIDPTT